MAKAKSKSPARSNRAPGASSRSRSSGKQQSALFRGGSLAQRTARDEAGPAGDAPDGEITSAAPPNVKALDEPGRASSPSFDERPVGGKEKDQETAKKPRGQKVEAGEGTAGDEGKVPDVHKLEDLPAGSSVDIGAGEIRIHAAIAGGGRKTFIGRTVEEALKLYNDFAENGPQLFPTGLTPEQEKDAAAQRDESDKAAAERSKTDLKARGITA